MDIKFPEDIIKGTFSIPKNKQQDILKGKIQRITIKGIELFKLVYLLVNKFSMKI